MLLSYILYNKYVMQSEDFFIDIRYVHRIEDKYNKHTSEIIMLRRTHFESIVLIISLNNKTIIILICSK